MTGPLSWPSERDLVVLGLMSGTSADGVDGALVRCRRGQPPALLYHGHRDFTDAERARVLALMHHADAPTLARAGPWIAGLYADAVAAFLPDLPTPPDLLAAHGQTVAHYPVAGADPVGEPPGTLQVLAPAVLAARTGIAVAADFRVADIAAGGQGAPLVPVGDLAFFGHLAGGTVVLNLGGIANITVIRRIADQSQVEQAFDTGPANMLLDEAMGRLTGGTERCDRGGARALQGQVDQPLLAKWLAEDRYVGLPPPKSTGREDYGAAWFDRWWPDFARRPANDVLATLAAFTAATVVEALRRFVLPRGSIDRCLVAGGGAFNEAIMRGLASRLAPVPVTTTSGLGMPVDAREAAAFAILGANLLFGLAGNVPAATGARGPVVAGSFTPIPAVVA